MNFFNSRKRAFVPLLCVALFVGAGCGKKEDKKHGERKTPITVVTVEKKPIQVVEHTLGHLESLTSPTVLSEVSGKIVKIGADVGEAVKKGDMLAEIDTVDLKITEKETTAGVKQLEAQVANQAKVVSRQRALVKDGFISKNDLDASNSLYVSLKEQLEGAKARLEQAQRNIGKTVVKSPVDGRVEKRLVGVGDYMAMGTPLFQLSTAVDFRIHLPFPESFVDLLKPGQKVTLDAVSSKTKIEGVIGEIKPMVGSVSKAVDAMVYMPNPGGWIPGGSVSADVVVEEHEGAIVVPELCLVRRPAGTIVYVVNAEKAEQRVVETGIRQNGMVEIVSGLKEGEIVAYDGAGFLTDKAAVTIKKEK